MVSSHSPSHIGIAALTPIVKKSGLPARMRSFDMGKAHGRHITCTVIGQPYQYGEEVTVSFRATWAGGKSVRFIEPTIEDFPDSLEYRAADFAGLGHKQLFISSPYGAVRTYVYDCNGMRVRKLYSLDEGRVGAHMVHMHGQWFLVEEWRYDQYGEDNDNMGAAFLITPPAKNEIGEVDRWLTWNGDSFVPIYPGPTRIIRHSPHAV